MDVIILIAILVWQYFKIFGGAVGTRNSKDVYAAKYSYLKRK